MKMLQQYQRAKLQKKKIDIFILRSKINHYFFKILFHIYPVHRNKFTTSIHIGSRSLVILPRVYEKAMFKILVSTNDQN